MAFELSLFTINENRNVKINPTPVSAALAGALAGIVMPLLWLRLASDSTSLVIAFLLIVALPAHAFVVGFDQNQITAPRKVDTALLKRVGAWLLSAVITATFTQALPA